MCEKYFSLYKVLSYAMYLFYFLYTTLCGTAVKKIGNSALSRVGVTWRRLRQSESLRDAAAASTAGDLSRPWGLSASPALPR